jgi:hypothetical protein
MKVKKSNKNEDFCKVGIHLNNPSKQEIESAKEDAQNKGFKTVWIHTKTPKETICRK